MKEMSPQEKARLDAIKKSWQQRRQVANRLSKIKIKLAVYSGKGGVGKTTVAVNLAVTLARSGAKVGLLDSDIDCPNATKVLNVSEKPLHENGTLFPCEKFGVKVISMAFFQQKEEEAIIWRGPMVHNAINQFLQMTDWGELDYLVTDLPPGTSDAPLTIMQLLPLDGFVVVSTPQELARLDAKRCINMIRTMKLNVLGVVENYRGEIFGSGGGEQLAIEMDIPFLGAFQMRKEYQNTGEPTVLVNDNVRQEYENVAQEIHKSLQALGKQSP